MFTQSRTPARFCLLLFALLVCFTATASAQVASPTPELVIPLEGLDPVLLTQGKEVQGDMKFKVARGRFEYLFANAETKATFEKDPTRYEIQLDGHCARMSTAMGNPDLYTVHKERIYIFGSEECRTLFKAAPEKYLEKPDKPKEPASVETVKPGKEIIAKAVGVHRQK